MGVNCSRLFRFLTLVFFLSFILLLLPLASRALAAADPLASDSAKAVLAYLRSLTNRSESRIVSGQFGEDSSEADDLAGKIGKYPGLIGRDYIWTSIASANADLISHWNANGLVTMSYHFNNPLGGDAWNTSRVNLVQLVTDGTSVNTAFKEQLDTLASGLTQLQESGVPVLLRLFHEMNGGWFWWGLRNAEEFKSMWIYTFNYLTQRKGLHNLLWVFAPETNFNFAYYPGSQYVDIIGIDIYGYGSNLPKPGGYDQLPSFDKPFGITELGLCSGGFYYPEVCPPKDISGIITSIKTKMPKAVFWISWGGVYSISYNLNAAQLMDDPWIITRDEINLSGIILPPPEQAPSPSPGQITVVPKNGWSLYRVDSEETVGEDGKAINSFDGNSATIWHTEWYRRTAPLPHEIQVNLGAEYNVAGFRYLPRQDGEVNGRIGQHEFYLSGDGQSWNRVATGFFTNASAEKEVLLAEAFPARYVALRALTEVNGNPWTSMAELTVLQLEQPITTPDGTIDRPSADLTIEVGGEVDFAGTGTSPIGLVPLAYLWKFGEGSEISNSSMEDPGYMQFNSPGMFTVTFTVADAEGSLDPTPATRVIKVTQPVPSDTVNPTVSISSPTNGSTVSRRVSVTVLVQAKDNVQLKKIELVVNSKVYSTQMTNVASIDAVFSWRPARGTYTLVAKATDSSDNVGVSSPIKVIVR